jgi:hypothetical protein
MASLRNYERGVSVGVGEVAEPSGDDDQAAAVAPVIHGNVVDESAERAAAFVTARGFGPNTINLIGYIAEVAVDTADLNAVIVEQMAARFATATSADDILDPFGTIKGEDLLDKPLYVTSCSFMESDIAEGFPWYVGLATVDQSTGRTTVVTVGGEKLVMQAGALDRAQAWPVMCRIHRADRPTKGGFYPLELLPVQ